MDEMNGPTAAIRQALGKLIADSEDWLMARVLHYAKQQRYTPYTSTLLEAWRLSVSGLSASLQKALSLPPVELELAPDTDYGKDPVAAFGVTEARRHLARGVNLGMFLGLMKYYRQAYQDLVRGSGMGVDDRRLCHRVTDRIFDRIEIGFVTAWADIDGEGQLAALQQQNRRMTNEKNKYLTVFESLPIAVVLVNEDLEVENMNDTARRLVAQSGPAPAPYYRTETDREAAAGARFADHFPWLSDALSDFTRENQPGAYFIAPMDAGGRRRHYHVRLSRMLDVSEKFRGTLVFLEDVTERLQAETALKESARLQGVLETAGAVGHELNQPLQSIMGNCELLFLDLDPSSPIYPRMSNIREQVYKMGEITRKLMGITRYRTKRYGKSAILDLDESSPRSTGPDGGR